MSFALTRLGFCGAWCMAGATALWAQDDEPAPRLTGEWGGARTRAEARGVSVYGNYTVEALANWRGGFARGESFEGVAEAGVELDLQALAGWTGATLFVGGMRVHGDDPSVELIGDYNYASNIVSENTTRFYHVWAGWQQGAFAARAGLLSVDDTFMVSETAQLFVNSGFGPMPTISGNTSAPIWPIAAPGVWAELAEVGRWRFQGGVFDGDGGDEIGNPHGLTVRLDPDEGTMTMVEAARAFSVAGRAGVFTAGGWLHSGELADFRTGETRRGHQGVYVMVEQGLTPTDAPGAVWTAFVRAGRALPDARGTVRFHGDVGVAATGLIPGRSDDVAGLAVCRTEFGRDYLAARELEGSPATRSETVLEATYAFSVGRGITVQPDLQYIFDPHESGRDAFVGVLRVSAEF
jgi:porin